MVRTIITIFLVSLFWVLYFSIMIPRYNTVLETPSVTSPGNYPGITGCLYVSNISSDTIVSKRDTVTAKESGLLIHSFKQKVK